MALTVLVLCLAQLSELRPYLPRMQPSALLRGMLTSSRTPKDNENVATLDQQVSM